jgi:DAK2 domain fusion protein YloV
MRPTKIKIIKGQDFREMFSAATNWLEKNAREIDALNVFPVPDGDCGTNMLLTMRSGIQAAYQVTDQTISSIAHAVARGALMGARGNSGVILSQVWRGIDKSLEGKEAIDGNGLAEALRLASEMAYKALSRPVEGTMLTVMRDVAGAARKQADTGENDITEILEIVVKTARESVANTPNLLPVLKESGVVDAGGQGLYTLFEGALRYLKAEDKQMKLSEPQIIAVEIPNIKFLQRLKTEEIPYGYSTEFILKGTGLNPDIIRVELDRWGKNLIVAGDESTVKVHIHAPDPGPVFSYAVSMGTMHQVTIRNLDEQYQEFLKSQKNRIPAVDIAIVAVVTGEGLAEVFRSLGVTAIVPGGQTMNPSTGELLQAVESVPSDKVIILPNNKNIVPAANQLPSLTRKQIRIVPTETIPQGVAALLAFNYQVDLETNTRMMAEAKSDVKTIEVTRAVRSARFGELEVKENQSIAFLNGNLIGVGGSPIEALNRTLAKLDLSEAEAVTIYYGAGTKSLVAEKVGEDIRRKYPVLQVGVINGGQPYDNYIISVE